jgi:hypothetical protein
VTLVTPLLPCPQTPTWVRAEYGFTYFLKQKFNENDTFEIGSYAPTTPFKTLARTTRPQSKASVAGPSSKPTGGAKRKKQKQSPEPSGAEEVGEHVEISSDHEEDDEVVAVAPPKGKRKEKKAPTPAEMTEVNGVGKGKGKGKAKADPPPKQSRHISEPMDLDDIELIGDIDNIAKQRRSAITQPKKDVSSKTFDRLRKQYETVRPLGSQLQAFFLSYHFFPVNSAERYSRQRVRKLFQTTTIRCGTIVAATSPQIRR